MEYEEELNPAIAEHADSLMEELDPLAGGIMEDMVEERFPE